MNLLKTLYEIHSPSGNEKAMKKFIKGYVSSQIDKKHFYALYGGGSCISRNFQKFIHQIHVVHNISVFGLSPVKHSMYQDQKAWDITRSTEVLVNLSANKLSPRKSIGENCLSCG